MPLGHLCIFLENSRFWKVAWFSLPLKVVELGTVAAWRMTFILVAEFVCNLGQIHITELQFFLQSNRRMIGIWPPPRIVEVEDSV